MKERDWNIIKLLSRKLLGQASADEERRLDTWRQENARHQQLWDELFRPEACAENEQRLAAFPPEERWREVEDRLTASRPRRIGRWMRYAAAVVLAAGLVGGGWHYLHRPSDTKDQQICAIEAGTTSAQLILGDHEVILLTSTDDRCIYNELQGVRILQEAGNLKYTTERNLPDTLIYNQVRTLTGMEYYVTLAEGTQIHLNAESLLTYPVFFQGDTRTVTFEGEGYFQVSRDAQHPFSVKLGDVSLEVLGTSFNIRAYADEPQMFITLESGALAMNGQSIKPGEQLIYDKESQSILIREVNTKEHVSWHEGHFLFRNERLEDILHYLARWYDFTYTFADEEAKNVRIGAYFERYNSLQPILNMLKRTELVDFEVKGKNIRFSSF